MQEQGFLRPEAVGSPAAEIEPEADLGPLAGGGGPGSPAIVDPGIVYDCGRTSPFNRHFEGLSETIDPKTWALIVKQKDLVLPGRNGFDLVIERVYNSQRAAVGLPGIDAYVTSAVQAGSESDWWGVLPGPDGEYDECYYRLNGTVTWERQPVDCGCICVAFSGTVEQMLWEPDYRCWTCEAQYELTRQLRMPVSTWGIVVCSVGTSAKLDTQATYIDRKYGIGLGWALAFPSVEVRSDDKLLHLRDGSVYRVDFSSGAPSNLVDYKLGDIVFAQEKASYPGAECRSAYCLAEKDGTRSYFASDGRLLWSADRFGNAIVFRYQKAYEWDRISQIVDSVGRIVQFTYRSSSVTVSVNDRTWVYALQPITAGDLIGSWTTLVSVTDPRGESVRYEYSLCEAGFGAGADGFEVAPECSNWYENLTRVVHPTGGASSYAYEGAWKNMTKDNPWDRDEYSMTVFRVTERYDEVSAQGIVNRSRFSYFKDEGPPPGHRWPPGHAWPSVDDLSYGALREALQASADGSGLGAERWAYNWEHLLRSHRIADALTGETKETAYTYSTSKLVIQEDTRVTAGANSGVTVSSMNYNWDAYGNLRSVRNALTSAETEYEYDLRYHLVVCAAEKADASEGSPAAWRYTINVLDDTGKKVISSSQSMQKPEWHAKPQLTAPVGRRLVNIGDAWTSWTAGPAGSAALKINWVRGFFQVVGYEVAYRGARDSEWITVSSPSYGWSMPRSGSDTVLINFPEPGVYSIRVRMSRGPCKWTYVMIVSTTEQPYERVFPAQTLAKSMVEYSYGDLGYPGNMTQITVAQPGGQDEITSFAYDSVGHAYPVSMSTSVAAANGVVSTVAMEAEYDVFGRVTKYTTRSGSSSSTTAFHYDEIGRLVKAMYPSGDGPAATKEWRWNDVDRTVARIDEEGRSLIEQYDQLGRFAELRRPAAPPNLAAAMIAKVGYNCLGGVAYEEDAAGRQTSYEYDGFGRRIKTVYPDGSFETALFEVCQGDPSGAVSVETRVDALGRYTKTYLDAGGRKVRVEQEAENRLSAVTRFEYDLLGRITRMVDPAGQETLYSYSAQTPSGTVYGYWDSPLEVDLPGGTEPVHKYMYDSCGRTIQSDGTANSYDELGRLKRATYPDGAYATFYYDKDSRLTEARLFDADRKPVCKTGADYDARGRKRGEWWDVWGPRMTRGAERPAMLSA